MEKRSFSPSMIPEIGNVARSAIGLVGIGIGGGFALKSIVNKVNNDAQCKRMLEDLALNDPILKTIDKGTLIEWYASMYNVAPTLAKDRQTVVETLRNFARFNKIDMSTLKLLAETEKNVAGSKGGGVSGTLASVFKF